MEKCRIQHKGGGWLLVKVQIQMYSDWISNKEMLTWHQSLQVRLTVLCPHLYLHFPNTTVLIVHHLLIHSIIHTRRYPPGQFLLSVKSTQVGFPLTLWVSCLYRFTSKKISDSTLIEKLQMSCGSFDQQIKYPTSVTPISFQLLILVFFLKNK